jgi:hypothetical protein
LYLLFKHPNEDAPTQELVQLKQAHSKFEKESKVRIVRISFFCFIIDFLGKIRKSDT